MPKRPPQLLKMVNLGLKRNKCHVNRTVDEKGLQHFRKRLGKEHKLAGTKRAKKNLDINENDLKSDLLQKVVALFVSANRLNDMKFVVEEITENSIDISIEKEGQTYGHINCIACENKKGKSRLGKCRQQI